MARRVGDFIKDIRYKKFWVISFEFRDAKYVYCKSDDRYKFLPVNLMTIEEASKCNIVKFDSEFDAKKELTTIPEFDISGIEVVLEVLENSYNEFLIGV